MAGLWQQTVRLSQLVKMAAEDSYITLEELINKAPEQSDTEKKVGLLKYINKTRQRLLRLYALTNWCTQIPFIQHCQQLEGSLSNHDLCFTQAADSLFFNYNGLQQARAPVYDVPSALEVLLTGSYYRLPKCIEDIGMQTVLVGEEQELALPKLDTLLRSRLLEVSLPKEISIVTVSVGRVVLHVEGEFKVQLTLGYRGHLSLWRILHLELLVGERSGLLKLDELQRFSIGDDLERRMAAAGNPFAILYSVLHEFCIALVMDTVIRQVKTLRQGRWKDAIHFELISDINSGQGANISQPQVLPDREADTSRMKTPGINIMYWVDPFKGIGGADLGCIPFLKIEPGQDRHITCSHNDNIFVIDPMTGNEAEFVLNQSCIDVECLLLRAISCNIHTRLLEVQRALKSNDQLCQAEDDIILKPPGNDSDTALNKISDSLQNSTETDVGELGEELLCVRAYGLSYMLLGINIRNGHFLLPSRNLMLPSAITECEEALNQGSLAPTEVFISLRNKSILHLFASIGRFLGLKVYEKALATFRIPKSIRQGSDLLLMGIPNCGNTYFLLIQLDVNFKPLFTMLESHQDSTGPHQIFRFRKIDVGRIQVVEEEANFSLLENELSLCSAKETGGSDISVSGPNSDSFIDAVIQGREDLQSAFSSVVDDIFEFDKGMTLPRYISEQKTYTSGAEPSPSSLVGAGQGIQKNVWQTGSSAPSGGHVYGPNTTSPARSPSFHKLSSASKNYSEQELISSRSPLHLGDTAAYPAMDEDELRKVIDSPKDGLRLYSSNRQTCVPSVRASPACRSPIQNSRSYSKRSPTSQPATMLKSLASVTHVISPVCQTSDSVTSHGDMSVAMPKSERSSRKRCLSDLVHSMPSLQQIAAHGESQKKRKTVCESGNPQPISSQLNTQGSLGQFVGRSYGNVLMEANRGKVPSRIYVSVLLQVVRQCFLCIKHGRITSQMEALGIPYIEDTGFQNPSADFWFRLPSSREDTWKNIGLLLGNPSSTHWDVKVYDEHFRDLWELHKGKSGAPWGCGARIADISDVDSHIQYGPEGVVLSYKTLEEDSIQKLVADLQRLSNARSFATGMKRLLGVKPDERIDTGKEKRDMKTQDSMKIRAREGRDRMCGLMGRSFRIEAVGLMSLWFSYFGSMPDSIARFIVEWEPGKEGCTVHVSADQLWPHTKFLEDFINGGEVDLLLNCIQLTAGPLHALSGAIRPARMVGTASTGIALVPLGFPTAAKTNGLMVSQGLVQSNASSSDSQATGGISDGAPSGGASGNLKTQNGSVVSSASRGADIVPSSLLPTDVSVVLRSPYWIRIIYRKNFAVDMRCFVGDQVWLQPATPPKGGPAVGGSMLCPQFQSVIMKPVAFGLNTLETFLNLHSGGPGTSDNSSINIGQSPAGSGNLMVTASPGISRAAPLPRKPAAILNRVTNVSDSLGEQRVAAHNSGMTLAGYPMAPGTGVPVKVRGELNSTFIELENDSGYGGGWVPLASLENVLRRIMEYLGALWLFSQLTDILRSILKENEVRLQYLDCEHPTLSFCVRGHCYSVTLLCVRELRLRMQIYSVKQRQRLLQQQQQNQTKSQQQQQNQTKSQDELSSHEIREICDFFSRRIASEPYDASRVASFVTLLLMPISVLREFLKLIAWKKGIAQGQDVHTALSQRPCVELCLGSHIGSNTDALMSPDNSGPGVSDKAACAVANSNIHYDRVGNAVDFGLIVVLDPACMPHVNADGGAAWLPCVYVRLKYAFGENPHVSLLSMEGSHRRRAGWPCTVDWECCKQRVAKAVEIAGRGSGACGSSLDVSQGRLRVVAETLQQSLQSSLLQLRKGATGNTPFVGGFTA